MRIQFIGTGAGDYYEAHVVDCRDQPCVKAKELGGRNIRHASSMLVAPDTLIDFSSGELLEKSRVATEEIRHVLVTHGHYDHFRPDNLLTFAADRAEPLTVHGSAVIGEALDFAATYEWEPAEANYGRRVPAIPRVASQVIRHGKSFQLGSMEVTPILANHMIDKKRHVLEQPAYNYVIARDGATLFYALDTSYTLPDSFDVLSRFKLDAMVSDATFGYKEIDPQVSGHLNFSMLDKTVARFRQAGILKSDAVVVASHISCHSVAVHDEIAGELADKGITLAWDGLTLDI